LQPEVSTHQDNTSGEAGEEGEERERIAAC